jgi:hypothetical protein
VDADRRIGGFPEALDEVRFSGDLDGTDELVHGGSLWLAEVLDADSDASRVGGSRLASPALERRQHDEDRVRDETDESLRPSPTTLVCILNTRIRRPEEP